MAKHKSITHTHPQAPAPRLAAALLVALGELMTVAVCVVGIVTIVGWLMVTTRSRAERHSAPQAREVWRCGWDRYGEFCRPVDRGMPALRHYARDGI